MIVNCNVLFFMSPGLAGLRYKWTVEDNFPPWMASIIALWIVILLHTTRIVYELFFSLKDVRGTLIKIIHRERRPWWRDDDDGRCFVVPVEWHIIRGTVLLCSFEKIPYIFFIILLSKSFNWKCSAIILL